MNQIWTSCDAYGEPDECAVWVEADGLRLGGDCEDIMEIAKDVWGIVIPEDNVEVDPAAEIEDVAIFEDVIFGGDPATWSPPDAPPLVEPEFIDGPIGGDDLPPELDSIIFGGEDAPKNPNADDFVPDFDIVGGMDTVPDFLLDAPLASNSTVTNSTIV